MTRDAPFSISNGYSCCEHHFNISKMELPSTIIMWNDTHFLRAVCWILLAPTIWNLVLWVECRSVVLRRLLGCPFRACYLVSLLIVFLSVYRSICVREAVLTQQKWWFFRQNLLLWSGHSLVILGAILMYCSLRTRGIVHTFYGELFGIEKQDVTGRFPFTWYRHPFCVGSFLAHVGYGLVQASQAALLLSGLLLASYWADITIHKAWAANPRPDIVITMNDEGRVQDISVVEKKKD